MNVALSLTAIILFLHLLGVEVPTVGKAQYWLDTGEPICIANFEEQSSLLDISSCCYGLQMQLRCEDWEEPILAEGKKLRVNKRCYTGEGAVEYFVNMKAYNYCKKEGYLGYKVI